jgi:hypothetical protein
MFEILKLLWDLVVLRREKRKGQLTAKVWLLAIGFVLTIYGVALPCTLLYQRDPAYKPLFIAAIGFVLCSFICVMCLGLRWQREARSPSTTNLHSTQIPARSN